MGKKKSNYEPGRLTKDIDHEVLFPKGSLNKRPKFAPCLGKEK